MWQQTEGSGGLFYLEKGEWSKKVGDEVLNDKGVSFVWGRGESSVKTLSCLVSDLSHA